MIPFLRASAAMYCVSVGVCRSTLCFTSSILAIIGLGPIVQPSLMPGAALNDLSVPYKFDLPIIVVKDLWTPGGIDNNSLVISLSYSGNTVETLTVTTEAINRGAEVIVVTSGGELLQIAMERGLPYIELTKNLLPRASFPEMLFSTLAVMNRMGLSGYISWGLLERSAEVLERVDDAVKHSELVREELKSFLPVFISCKPYSSIAIRLKNDLAENSGIYSFYEILPEAGHNSIEALTSIKEKKGYKLVFIVGSEGICRSLLSSVIETIGRSSNMATIDLSPLKEPLIELVWGYWVSGFASAMLARDRGVNPDETPLLKRYRENVRKLLFVGR
jgi:glucose/mannose-6-phosphate isomerase